MSTVKEPAALVINDVHLHLTTLETGKDVLRQGVELCGELGISYLILNGDLFTERKGQPLEVLLAVLWFKKLCQQAGITVLCIPGNHDKTDQESEASFLDLFHDELNSFRVFQKESVVRIQGAKGGPLDIYLLPYFPEHGSLGGRLESLVGRLHDQWDENQRKEDWDGYTPAKSVLCMHAAINGVRNNDGSEVNNEIASGLFSSFTTVVVGHYHNASQIGKNIFYTGSAYPRNHGEDNGKGFAIVYVDGSLKAVKAVFPEYVSYELHPEDLTPEMIQSLRKEKETTDGNIRVVIKAPKAELKTYDLAPLLSIGIDAKKKPQELDEAIEAAAENRVESHTTQTLVDQFEHFADGHGFPDEVRLEGRELLADLT